MPREKGHSITTHSRTSASGVPGLFIVIYLYCVLLFASLPLSASAAEISDNITADSLEYDEKTQTITGKGSVEIKTVDFRLTADEIIYFRDRADVEASGNVRYEDRDSVIHAGRAFFNTEAKTGRLYDAKIAYRKSAAADGKKDDEKLPAAPLVPEQGKKAEQVTYYIEGREVEKRGDLDYYSTEARITTCDAPVPAWCFRGKDISLLLGDSLRARNASLTIKDVPVLYTPYLWAPLTTERKSGFLIPVMGYSDTRGLNFNLPFFWAIAENRDATFILDLYSDRGIGSGVEYRSLTPGGGSSNWWVYHIRDTELKKDYLETKLTYVGRHTRNISSFLNINHVNEKDFYREYSTQIQTRTLRFLESAGEVQMPLENSRIYFLSQYWVDLKENTGEVPQRLPEIGYVLHSMNAGPVLVSGTATASNIWRENGFSARRLDLYPGVSHSFGGDFVVSQKANLRATLYSYYKDRGEDDSAERSAFEYDVLGHARFFKKYAGFTHVAEPGIRYHYITSSENSLPPFDSTEMYGKTSRIEVTLMNRFLAGGREALSLRLAQGMETYYGDRPFLPLSLEMAMNSPFPLKLNASYDVHTGRLSTVTSDLGIRIFQSTITFGERYNRAEDVLQYRTGITVDFDRSVQLAGGIWYDAKVGKTTDMRIGLRYLAQCWGFKVELEKKPDDYSISFMYELTGLVSNIPRK